jgi:hypothetical protein
MSWMLPIQEIPRISFSAVSNAPDLSLISAIFVVSSLYAGMAELADAADSKSAGLRPLGVRFPLPAPT